MWAHLGALVLLVCAVYANSLNNSFQYDDSHSLVENPHIRHLANIPRFYSDPALFSREPAMAMYRPLVLTSYAVNYALGGYRPAGYRAVNILLHAASVVLVYMLLRPWVANKAYAWWGSALWGIHPIQSQAVNYISARAEILAALAVLAALWLILKKKWPAAGAVYALGLLAKSTAVVLVPLWLGQTLWQQRGRRWAYGLISGGITLGYLVLIWANGFLSGSVKQEVRGFAAQVFTQTKALVYYLKLISMPVHLSVEHAFNESRSWHEGAVVSSGLLLFSLVYLAWRGWLQRVPAAWAWGWFLACVGLTFIWPLNVLVNEHRLYLASASLAWMPVLAFAGQRPGYGLAIGGLALLLGSGLTLQRNRVWHSEYSLWQDAVTKAPGMFRAQSNWGLAQYNQGQLAAAEASLKKALGLNPGYAKTWNNLGLVHEEAGNPKAARDAYARAVRLRPELAGPYTNLGRMERALGNMAQAGDYLRRAVEKDPNDTAARLNLGLYYQQTGQYEAAARQYRQVLVLAPESAAAYNNLGLLYQDMGALEQARQALEQAMRLAPEDPAAQVNLALLTDRVNGVPPLDSYNRLIKQFPNQATLWQGLGDVHTRQQEWSQALAAYAQANRLDPANILLYPRWGDACLQAGKPAEAIVCYQQALAGLGQTAGLYTSLAAAYAAAGDIAQALAACRKALELDPGNQQAQRNMATLLQAAERGDPSLPGKGD